jgi:hypothetical protein
MPEHAGRMRGADGEVNTDAESSPTAVGGSQRPHKSVLDPHGVSQGEEADPEVAHVDLVWAGKATGSHAALGWASWSSRRRHGPE